MALAFAVAPGAPGLQPGPVTAAPQACTAGDFSAVHVFVQKNTAVCLNLVT